MPKTKAKTSTATTKTDKEFIEIITNAIIETKDSKGITRTTITKYIVDNHKDIKKDSKLSATLIKILGKCIDSQYLVYGETKHRYKLNEDKIQKNEDENNTKKDAKSKKKKESKATKKKRAKNNQNKNKNNNNNNNNDDDDDDDKNNNYELVVGSDAPNFCDILDENGNKISLANFDNKYLILYFYPKDLTPGCTAEGKGFNQLLDKFKELNADILGVSADTKEMHQKFINKHNFNFSLLADTNFELINMFQANKNKNKVKRCTYLIDKNGKILYIWNPVRGAAKHPQQVLNKLIELTQNN